jgi:hypothetical protein
LDIPSIAPQLAAFLQHASLVRITGSSYQPRLHLVM